MANTPGRLRSGLRNFKNAAAERFAIRRIQDKVLYRRVAKTPWYHGDGATLMILFATMVATGLGMLPSYSNSTESAYESVLFITHQQYMGGFVRALHYWAAGTMVVMLLFHFFRQLLIGGYKPPREGTWTTGVFIFFMVITMAFTGYVLRWDERAIYAVRVALSMFYEVPWIGENLVHFVQGGFEIGEATLSRFFSVHVLYVPLLLFALIGYHLYLVIVHGVTSIAEREIPVSTGEEQKKVYKEASRSEESGEHFHPTTIIQITVMAFLIFCIPVGLALIYGPQELQPEANLVNTAFPAEEWWFWWVSATIALLPPALVPWFVVGFPVGLFVFMLILPLIDRGPNRGIGRRPFWAFGVTAAVLALLILSGLRMESRWTGWPAPTPPPVPEGVELDSQAEQGRLLTHEYGCMSCHSVAGWGRKVGPDLARISGRLSKAQLTAYILDPPDGVAMPSYRGRLSEEELDQLAEFVLVAQTFPRERR